jgi:hypothetical protein
VSFDVNFLLSTLTYFLSLEGRGRFPDPKTSHLTVLKYGNSFSCSEHPEGFD